MARGQPEQLVVMDDTPGRLLAAADLVVGDSVSQAVSFTPAMREAFGVLARDGAPVHADAAFARARGYDAPILQGMCVTTRFSRLIGMYLPGESAVVESLSFKFRKPVYADATVQFTVTITRLLPALRVARLQLAASVAGEPCIAGEAQCVLR